MKDLIVKGMNVWSLSDGRGRDGKQIIKKGTVYAIFDSPPLILAKWNFPEMVETFNYSPESELYQNCYNETLNFLNTDSLDRIKICDKVLLPNGEIGEVFKTWIELPANDCWARVSYTEKGVGWNEEFRYADLIVIQPEKDGLHRWLELDICL